MIHTVLFDLDGTLLDTLTDMQDAVNHVLAAYGLPLRTLEEVRRFVGNGAGPLIHRALPEGYPQEQKVLADAIQKEAKVPSGTKAKELKKESQAGSLTTEKIVQRDKLTTLMITHNMRDAIAHGNRLIMMHEGRVIYDVSGEEKKNLKVSDLLAKFEEVSGGEFANDRMMLA